MSELTDILEGIKQGELGVVAAKLTSLQAEITNALSLISGLTTEVEGSVSDVSNPVGCIHSPARTGNVNESIEMFIGTYYVGDILTASSSANSKVGKFIFGAGSKCQFYFMPSDPLDGVNKKYVDQIVSPINSQLSNMINRTGDRCPNNTGTVGECTYIFTSDGTEYVRWLLDGMTNSQETNFNTFDSSQSLFWLNVDDARYFGTTTNAYNLITRQATDADYLRRTGDKDVTKLSGTSSEVNAAGILFTNSNLHLDDDSKATWADTNSAFSKGDTELANIKNVKELLANTADANHSSGPSRTASCGWVVLGQNPALIIYWAITDSLAVNTDGDDGGYNTYDPIYDIGLPANLFTNVMHVSATKHTREPESTTWKQDVWVEVTGFTKEKVRIMFNNVEDDRGSMAAHLLVVGINTNTNQPTGTWS